MENHRPLGTLRLCCTTHSPRLASRRRMSWSGTRLAVPIRMFAGVYPNEVAGLVFVDPTPDLRTSDDDVSEVFVPLGLGQKERDEMRALRQKPDPATPKSILTETAMSSAMSASGFPEIQALPPLRDIPVVVLAGNSDTEWPTSMPVSFDMHRWVRQWLSVRNASLRRFATSLARGTFVETTASSHRIQNSEPGLIALAIERVLQQR